MGRGGNAFSQAFYDEVKRQLGGGAIYFSRPDGSLVQAATKVGWTLTHDVDGNRLPSDASSFGEIKTYTVDSDAPGKDEPYILTFEGMFQGSLYTITVDIVEDSPIEAVIAEVFDLDAGDTILSILVGHEDGSTEVRPCRTER